MTSQLILGNGRGLAIASDSAATSGPRTRNDATKISHLGDPHRVAILQSGAVNLLGMPLAVLVAEWQQTLGDRRMSLEGYRDNFTNWLDHNLSKWTTEADMDDEFRVGFEDELVSLREYLEQKLATVSAEEHHDVVLRQVQEEKEWIAGKPVVDVTLSSMADEIVDRLDSRDEEDHWTPKGLIGFIFKDLPRSDQIDQELDALLRLMVGRSYRIPSWSNTHLTFAGYGAEELVPSVAEVIYQGAVSNHVVRRGETAQTAIPKGRGFALFKPIAQTWAMDLLIGMHNPNLLREAINRQMAEIDDQGEDDDSGVDVEDITEGESGADRTEDQRLSEIIQAFSEGIVEKSDSISETFYHEKFLRTLATFEMPSLVETARALIAVQALTIDISGEQPTVGGHIDVAAMTLRDGFTWVSHVDLTG